MPRVGVNPLSGRCEEATPQPGTVPQGLLAGAHWWAAGKLISVAKIVSAASGIAAVVC